jgi:pimeloyl-ACP methyl ester carboxylesterase
MSTLESLQALRVPLNDSIPTLFVPGLFCSPRLYGDQIPALWRFGPVTVADNTRDDSIGAIAGRILMTAPPSFVLIGLSMGGYIALELLRQAPDRVLKLALLDTTARPDSPEQSEQRLALINLAERGRYSEIPDLLYPRLVHSSRLHSEGLRQTVYLMAEETGSEAFVRQERAITNRPDSRPSLGAISCPTLMIVGDSDQITPPERAREIVAGIPGARLAILEECGHLSTLEQPDRVTRLLVEFLTTV